MLNCIIFDNGTASGAKNISKLYLSKSIVTYGKTTRNKEESIDCKKHLSKSKNVVI